MSGMLSRATRKFDHSGQLCGIYNSRARLSGALLVFAGLVMFGSASKTADVLAIIVYALLGLCLLGFGYRVWAGFSVSIGTRSLRLRSGYKTREIPLAEVDECRPTTSPPGLIYPAAALEVALTSGEVYEFNSIQWSLSRLDVAESDCSLLTDAVRRHRA